MSEVFDNLHPALRELPGKTIVGRYKVDKVLGLGGMGAVFRGRHIGLERDVAIKVLHPDLTRDPEISKRFDREAHSASRLDHPNCLRVTDVGSTDEGLKFMVMDLLSGKELADLVGDPLPPDRAVLLILQILRGLEHAHENGVIHRDIKPENVFVTRDHDGREVLKLVDFGIAKLVGGGADDRMTKAGLIFGTPAYMSPEQAMGMEADHRADLYSVGIILYEMLNGTPPFANPDPVKLVRMQVSKDPPPLPEAMDMGLVSVCMRLLAKDRDERFQSATEAREALELVLPGVASSEVVSGRTIHGASGPIFMDRSVTGPLPMHDPASGPFPRVNPNDPRSTPFPRFNPNDPSSVPFDPISGPFPRVHNDTSSGFAPSALPTLPPQAGMRRKTTDRRPLIIGGAIVVLAGVWAITSSDDESEAEAGTEAVAGEGVDGPAGDDEEPVILEDFPEIEEISEIDRLILGKKYEDAQKLLQPLLDQYPDHPLLAWREGRILAASRNKRKNRPKALVAYEKAIDAAPFLLDDNEFYAELYTLMSDPRIRSEALDLALRKMGSYGHKFLLEAINNEKDPMDYTARKRAIEELATNPDNEVLINPQLHRALNLLQATEAIAPCTAYREALEVIASEPEYYYLTRVQHADMPKPKKGDDMTADEVADAKACEGLEERRDEVIEVLQTMAPTGGSGGEEVIIIEDDPAPTPAKTTHKKKSTPKSSSGSNDKPHCLGIFRRCK